MREPNVLAMAIAVLTSCAAYTSERIAAAASMSTSVGAPSAVITGAASSSGGNISRASSAAPVRPMPR